MNALQGLDRYQKEVIRVSTRKHDIKVQYLYNIIYPIKLLFGLGGVPLKL